MQIKTEAQVKIESFIDAFDVKFQKELHKIIDDKSVEFRDRPTLDATLYQIRVGGVQTRIEGLDVYKEFYNNLVCPISTEDNRTRVLDHSYSNLKKFIVIQKKTEDAIIELLK